jgi:hypothetical protein
LNQKVMDATPAAAAKLNQKVMAAPPAAAATTVARKRKTTPKKFAAVDRKSPLHEGPGKKIVRELR